MNFLQIPFQLSSALEHLIAFLIGFAMAILSSVDLTLFIFNTGVLQDGLTSTWLAFFVGFFMACVVITIWLDLPHIDELPERKLTRWHIAVYQGDKIYKCRLPPLIGEQKNAEI